MSCCVQVQKNHHKRFDFNAICYMTVSSLFFWVSRRNGSRFSGVLKKYIPKCPCGNTCWNLPNGPRSSQTLVPILIHNFTFQKQFFARNSSSGSCLDWQENRKKVRWMDWIPELIWHSIPSQKWGLCHNNRTGFVPSIQPCVFAFQKGQAGKQVCKCVIVLTELRKVATKSFLLC